MDSVNPLTSGAELQSSCVLGRRILIALPVALLAFIATHLLPIPGSLQRTLEATGGQPILDLKPSFSAGEVYQRLSDFGAEGRAAYQRMIVTMDLVFPASVFAFLLLLARYTRAKLAPPPFVRWALVAAPFGFFVPDLVENLSVYLMLRDFPARHDALAASIGYVTVVKRLSLYAALLIPGALFLANAARRLPMRHP